MGAVLACALALSLTSAHAKTIMFRDDDAEAYFSVDILRTVTDTVISKGVPQTIGVIPSHPSGQMLYEDPALVAYLNSIKGQPGVELALHGYQHSYTEFATLNVVDAEARIAAGLGVLQSVLGVTPTTFIPPQNAFNADTLQACVNEGLTRFSAAGYNDPNAFTELPVGLLHVPSTVDFQDWDNGGVVKSSSAIIQECQAALASQDAIVIQIHFWAFADDNDLLDPVLYQTLVDVLSWIRAQAAQGVTLTTIGQYVRPPAPVVTKTLKVAVTSASDDAYEAAGTMYPAAVIAVVGKNGTKAYRAGYRFGSIQLPKTARVLSATLKLACNWASGTTDTVLYGEANDLSVTFSTTQNDLSSRTRTVANVPWNGMPVLSWGKPLSSPDVTAIVQEIVSRPTWQTGNPITFLQYEAPTAANTWEAITFEGAGTSPLTATLEIAYVETVDQTPPQISATRTPQANAFGWNNSPVTASYSATPGGSALVTLATGSFGFGTEGMGQVHIFTVTDAVGNRVSATVSDVNIDLTAPVVLAVATPAANAAGWNNSPVTVMFSGSDALSGVSSTAAPVVLSADGVNQAATGTCTDKAGNVGSITLSGINIDQTPPQISVTRSPQPNAAGWNNSAVTITYSATDSGSGLLSPATGSFVFDAEGAGQSHTFTVTDAAGNSASVTVSGVNINLGAAPVPVITGYPPNPSTATNPTFAFTDTDSGVTFLCQLDLGGYQICTSPVSYTNLAQGSHRFDVKARNVAGNESAVASYLWNINSRPLAPTALAATAGNASVTLTWQAVANATSYNVKRATASGGPYTVVATGIAATTWTNTGLTNGKTYYYVVSAVNAAGEGANSAQVSATPLVPPAAPTSLAVAVTSSTQLKLTWTDSSTNETGFRIERSTNGTTFSEIATVGANVKTFASTGLTPNTTYYYRIRAYNAGGNSAYTAVKSAKTKK